MKVGQSMEEDMEEGMKVGQSREEDMVEAD